MEGSELLPVPRYFLPTRHSTTARAVQKSLANTEEEGGTLPEMNKTSTRQ